MYKYPAKPKLLLHCCCAPCTSSVLERLCLDYEITLLFYNPNIEPYEEYKKRASEMMKLSHLRLIISESDLTCNNQVKLIISDHNNAEFNVITELYQNELEGFKRCRACFELRLGKTAQLAKSGGYDFFTTTLSVSPHKDSKLLNEIGNSLSETKPQYLCADFKKRDGFKRSIELSKQYGLYRQNYCGCIEGKN